ncbi:DUF3093 domain-containing protein [Nocardioides marmoriginsengisoli]|uniref:DUF3093 domain-containing protein n=1 Tax=Nocardioides marmoriginsengisoli TaxID=661483 RepID=A0A3N0CNF0_9ACTN|nr:DUF3093 domain-containing protein [Nocardioides marmoriginsengisoli]RNL64869.1 DUF3093 domain-containing protein [Nocardioides marmoriginsengisoli]
MPTHTAPPVYAERLYVPLRWWVQATMFLATVWLAFTVALPPWLAASASGSMLAVVFGLFAWVGSVRVEVRDGVLHVGRAKIALEHLGAAEPLDKDATRRVHGVDADVRAFLQTRPYLSRSVRVPIEDPADPTPYWLVSTRHPRQLAAALGGPAR